MKRCPRCDNNIIIVKLNGEYGVICLRCGIRYRSKAKNEEQAYIEFLEKFNIKIPSFLKKYIVGIFVDYRLLEQTEIEHSDEKVSLDSRILQYLKEKNIKLYKFQVKAIKYILKGKNVIIIAPTASGKTEAFTLPIVHRILQNKKGGTKAIFVYPTKALARDQLKKFKEIESLTGVRFAIFDGDTPLEERRRIISDPPDIIITNPDMIHLSLIYRTDFSFLLKNIKFLVLDEIHEYTGAFGTNMHFIIRRLKRFSKFQIIGASATISNPKEFAELLLGKDIEIVEEHGRKSKMHFLMLYPDKSYYTLILRLLKKIDKKTLVFVNTHREAEILYKLAKKAGLKVGIHRSGLSREMRIEMEEKFKKGEINYLISTPTLELGINIGHVECVISLLVNYSRLLQRIGRAGRKGQESLGFLVLRNNDPISNYYKENPREYFSDIEPAYLEPKNEEIAYWQILAASLDSPLSEKDFEEFKDIKEKLLREGLVRKIGTGRIAGTLEGLKKLKNYSIRGISDRVKIVEGKRIIGERALPMALRELHPGAIYLHGGRVYVSKRLEKRKAIVERSKEEHLKTEALRTSIPEILEILENRKAFSTELKYCKLKVTEIVHGYVIKNIYTNKKLSIEKIQPVEYTFITKGFVFTCPALNLHPEGLAGSYHAVEHVLIESSNMLIGGGANEIGGISMGSSGVIFIYDGAVGGNGISKLLYNRFEKACRRALEVLESCKCKKEDGCPNCTYSYQCGNNNRPLNKYGAIRALKKLIRGEKIEFMDFIGERPYI